MITFKLLGQQPHKVAQSSSISLGCSSENYKIKFLLLIKLIKLLIINHILHFIHNTLAVM